MLSVRFEGVSLLLAPARADKRGPQGPFFSSGKYGIQLAICNIVPTRAPAGAESYWKHWQFYFVSTSFQISTFNYFFFNLTNNVSMIWIKGLTLKLYLDNLIESVQPKALHIIFPAVDYNSALYQSELKTLNDRRKEICTTFISYVRGNGLEPICSLLPAIVNHPLGYGLWSGGTSQSCARANTDRLGNFITSRYA